MTDKQLARIRKRLDTPILLHTQLSGHDVEELVELHDDAADLLAEVERLRDLVQREHDARLEVHREAETLLRERDAAKATNEELRRTGLEQADTLARLTGGTIERLEAENAALREIAQAVADADPVFEAARTESGLPSWLPSPIPPGLITKARALLAGEQRGGSMTIQCEAAGCQNTMPSQRRSWRIRTAGRVSFACSALCASAVLGVNTVGSIWDPEEDDDDGECPRCHCDAWTPGRISADCDCACHRLASSEQGARA